MANKKIINATPHFYDGIQFKSNLEVTCYKVLIENGFSPLYEQKHFTVFKGYVPKVPFYVKNIFKKKNCKINVLSSSTAVDNRNVLSWKYTPDFYFKYEDYIIYIEVKGYSNDVVRYKKKLFRWQLEKVQKRDSKHKYEFWEIHTKKQLLECIDHIKKNKQ